MDDTIFDGEAHALSKDYGYIAKRIHEVADESKLSEYVDEQLVKFCDYLYENDKEKVCSYLMGIFKSQVFHGSTDENFQLIFRPPHMVSCLAQFATLALKFKRAEKDNLEAKSEQV
ncbi:hypothetical protein UFOVP256_15 [uncultured Caudovirales phage]|uniref:Uncharacterized protein n=1 Tax=uncultured Caudovirales phage TaxID=2100421 RepID=A0A6J5LGN6_9CAUD|nr:hypothetical protein UFOVP256_15 [uncultured Caudovirales phage]